MFNARFLPLVLVSLALTGCAHGAHRPVERPLCTAGFVALYFAPDDATFAAPFGESFGALGKVTDRCVVDEIVVTGLPDPRSAEPVDALTRRRAEHVRTMLSFFHLPAPSFEPGDEIQRTEPGIVYKSHPRR